MQFISFLDYLLFPLYFWVIHRAALNFRNAYYPEGHPWRPYFMPGLVLKMCGATFIGLVYQYYYGNGDTAMYFNQARVLNESFLDSPVKWFNLLFHIPKWYDATYLDYTSRMEWYDVPSSFTVIVCTAVLSLLSFNTYLPATLLFALLSFTGMWAIFRTFAEQYPRLVKYIAYAVLYVPSIVVWGSGIFKDTLCMFGFGWLIFGVFKVLIKGRLSVQTFFVIGLSFYLIFIVKIYILIAFVPSLILWIFLTYSYRIKNAITRVSLAFLLVSVGVVSFFLFMNVFAKELGQYSLDNIAKASAVTRDWILESSGENSSTYDLGEIEPTTLGMLQKLPQAINVTLFRPYVWEARKPIVMINALESLLFLYLVIKVIYQIGLRKIIKALNSDPNIQFCLLFTLIFAFAVGISTYNFGSLSRYKIPCMPTFGMALVLIYYKYKDPQTESLL